MNYYKEVILDVYHMLKFLMKRLYYLKVNLKINPWNIGHIILTQVPVNRTENNSILTVRYIMSQHLAQ